MDHRQKLVRSIAEFADDLEVVHDTLGTLRKMATRGGPVRKCLDLTYKKIDQMISEVENAAVIAELERTLDG